MILARTRARNELASCEVRLMPRIRTSRAVPHVAGVAALHWQALGDDVSAVRVAAALIASARRKPFARAFAAADHGAGLVTTPRQGGDYDQELLKLLAPA
jgi:hypothetical protein